MSAHWRSLAGDAGKTKERTSEREGTAAGADSEERRDRTAGPGEMLAGKWALPEDGCVADEAIMFGVCIPRWKAELQLYVIPRKINKYEIFLLQIKYQFNWVIKNLYN